MKDTVFAMLNAAAAAHTEISGHRRYRLLDTALTHARRVDEARTGKPNGQLTDLIKGIRQEIIELDNIDDADQLFELGERVKRSAQEHLFRLLFPGALKPL